jgi:hypothetical protein
LLGSYESIDRLGAGRVLRSVQRTGSVLSFMKAGYPGEEWPLQHFPNLTQWLKAGMEALLADNALHREAERASEPEVQPWLEPL